MKIVHWVDDRTQDRAVCGRRTRLDSTADDEAGVTCRECSGVLWKRWRPVVAECSETSGGRAS